MTENPPQGGPYVKIHNKKLVTATSGYVTTQPSVKANPIKVRQLTHHSGKPPNNCAQKRRKHERELQVKAAAVALGSANLDSDTEANMDSDSNRSSNEE